MLAVSFTLFLFDFHSNKKALSCLKLCLHDILVLSTKDDMMYNVYHIYFVFHIFYSFIQATKRPTGLVATETDPGPRGCGVMVVPFPWQPCSALESHLGAATVPTGV